MARLAVPRQQRILAYHRTDELGTRLVASRGTRTLTTCVSHFFFIFGVFRPVFGGIAVLEIDWDIHTCRYQTPESFCLLLCFIVFFSVFLVCLFFCLFVCFFVFFLFFVFFGYVPLSVSRLLFDV